MAIITFFEKVVEKIDGVPGDFYTRANGVTFMLIHYGNNRYALVNADTGDVETDSLSGPEMRDHLNSTTQVYTHRPNSKIVIV